MLISFKKRRVQTLNNNNKKFEHVGNARRTIQKEKRKKKKKKKKKGLRISLHRMLSSQYITAKFAWCIWEI